VIASLKILSLLLSYPSEELKAGVPELRETLAHEAVFSPVACAGLDALLGEIERENILDLQGAYVDLFDRTRSLSLHLFEHVHGESRERGQAMIDLRGTYANQGLLMVSDELPDYLPAFFEFASLLPLKEARQALAEPVHVLEALHERLRERETPYASVLRAAIEFSGARAKAEVLQELRAAPDPRADDFEAVDKDWEEAPVKFGPEQPTPTDFMTKLRAWARPASGVDPKR
jgi:nitrate reductase delta subunit